LKSDINRHLSTVTQQAKFFLNKPVRGISGSGRILLTRQNWVGQKWSQLRGAMPSKRTLGMAVVLKVAL